MNAVILPHAGIAIVLQGDAFSALDVRDLGQDMHPLHPAEIPYLLLGRPDLRFLEDVSLARIREELLTSWDRFRALDLALIVLDRQAQWATRQDAARLLERLLRTGNDMDSFLKWILSARPLPSDAHLNSAFHAAESVDGHQQWRLLREVELAQPVVRNWRSRIPSEPTSTVLPRPVEAGFMPLFDGTQDSFDRWEAVGRGAFELDAGHIVTVPGGDIGLLYYTPKMFANFILRLDFQLTQPVGDHNDSSGVLIRFKHPRHPVGDRVSPGTSHVYYNQAYVAVHTGLEVQIDDMARGDSSREFQGTPYDVPAGDRIWHQHAPPLSPGVWFHYEIDVQDRLIVVRLAGMQTTRYENTDSFRGQSPGYIGLQAHRGHVRFTNVRIKEQ